MIRLSKYIFLFGLVLFALFSCNREDEKFKGFKKTPDGLYYKLLAFGDSKEKPSKEKYIKLAMIYKTENDSVFLDTKNQNPTGKIILPVAEVDGLLGDGIKNMNDGDSVMFILNAGNLFDKFFKTPLPLFLNKGSMVKVGVKLDAILDKKQYDDELSSYEETLSTWDVEEQRRIKKYIEQNKLNAVQQSDGMYYLSLKEGSGAKADSGRVVSVLYNGYFLDGRKFDSAAEKKPFEFRIGDEFQLVWGLQQGIKLMREGGKAKFIIPSYLAFGEDGSSTGIVPPFTTVMYEVELIKVK